MYSYSEESSASLLIYFGFSPLYLCLDLFVLNQVCYCKIYFLTEILTLPDVI